MSTEEAIQAIINIQTQAQEQQRIVLELIQTQRQMITETNQRIDIVNKRLRKLEQGK